MDEYREKILVVDDEENIRHLLTILLERHDYVIVTTSDPVQALKILSEDTFDIVLSDVRMPQMSGLELLTSIQKRNIDTAVIIMSAYGNNDTAIEAVKRGAYDYINKPLKKDELLLVLRKAIERKKLLRDNFFLRQEVEKTYDFKGIITQNEKMLEILRIVRKIANYNSTVLVTGESGTGKELIAKAVHYSSIYKENPFIAINCGAIPENLLESELFGHAKGAFTNADKAKKGLMEEANNGTLFLDEIGELSMALQVKILRALEEREIRRVGDNKVIPLTVRVIAATSRNLKQEVINGNFREDLFYRLNVIHVSLPPLRERKEDISILVDEFIRRFNVRMKKNISGIFAQALMMLVEHPWPGNVRELENCIEHAVVLTEGEKINTDVLPLEVIDFSNTEDFSIKSSELSIKKVKEKLEKHLIKKALQSTNGNKTHAARLLEISIRSLLMKIKEYKIE